MKSSNKKSKTKKSRTKTSVQRIQESACPINLGLGVVGGIAIDNAWNFFFPGETFKFNGQDTKYLNLSFKQGRVTSTDSDPETTLKGNKISHDEKYISDIIVARNTVVVKFTDDS